jgi:hypothetical protein
MRYFRILLLSFLLQSIFCVEILAQEPIKARTFSGQNVLLYPDGTWKPAVETGDGSKTVILLSRRKYDDYEKATFSFQHGLRDDPKNVTHNDWDLLFGNGDDVFDVTMVVDRSRIRDLGAIDMDSLETIPALPAYETPTREKSLPAVVGHVYLVHTKDNNSDLYAIFRVEWLEPGDSCMIRWKVVPSPEGL